MAVYSPQVLSYHYAPNQLFYPRWTEDTGGRAINFFVGFPENPLPANINQATLTAGRMNGAGPGGKSTDVHSILSGIVL